MLKILKIEWMKLKYYRTFWVLFVFFILSLFAVNYLAYSYYKKHMAGVADGVLAAAPFSFPHVWQTVSYISGFLLFIPGLLIITLITNEMTFRTHRQNIIDGISRSQFINAKFLLVLIFSSLFTVAVFLCCLLLGFSGNNPISFDNSIYIVYFFLQCISYSGLALLFGLFVKRSGIAIGLFFLYAWVLEKILSALMNVISGVYPGNYLPLSATDKLIPFPFSKSLATRLSEVRYENILLLMTVVYLVLYYWIGTRKIKTEDL